MDPKEFEKHLAKMRYEVKAACSRKLPVIVGARLVEMMKTNFQTQSFFDRKWKDVKRRLNPTPAQRKSADSKRLILTGRTGNLGRSIDYQVENARVVVKSDLVYSAIHNWGGHAGRGLRTVIPQRQFIGHHKQTDREIKRLINELISKMQ